MHKNVRQRILLIALLAAGLALSITGEATAGCWTCAHVGYYEQPVPVVRRPAVVLTPQYLTEYVPCGDGVVVNQGQYHTEASLIPRPRCFYGDAPVSYRN
jgi:hypothetical protein